MPYLLLQSLTDYVVLVLCNVHIRSHPLSKQHFLKEWYYDQKSPYLFFLHFKSMIFNGRALGKNVTDILDFLHLCSKVVDFL